MERIFIDIETIPDLREGAAEAATSRIRAPSNYKDPEKIRAYVEEKGAEAWRQTSLDGSYGQVFCIGFAVDGEPAEVITRADLESESEYELLMQFWAQVNFPTKAITWVGHNILGFDLPFLWKRHVVYGVRPKLRLPYNVGPWSDEVDDTMLMWTGQRTQFITLDELLSVLGVPSGDPIEGKEVWEYVANGQFDVVEEHCRRNVEEMRTAWRHMQHATLR